MKDKEREKLYTIRWYVREKWSDPSSKDDVLELLSSVIDPGLTPEERPSISSGGAKALWCPFAEIGFPKSKTRGSYSKGYPQGAIVHFTAGRRRGLKAGMEEQVENGYTYFIIDQDGNIGQNFPLDSWGYHAGKSSWEGLGDGVSDDLVGIEIQAAGKLTKKGDGYETYYHVPVPLEEVRVIKKQTENQEAGAYQIFTEAQEEALYRLLTWLRMNNPDVFKYKYVLGHDEVSPGRKNDPGGALSMTMPALRKKLTNEA